MLHLTPITAIQSMQKILHYYLPLKESYDYLCLKVRKNPRCKTYLLTIKKSNKFTSIKHSFFTENISETHIFKQTIYLGHRTTCPRKSPSKFNPLPQSSVQLQLQHHQRMIYHSHRQASRRRHPSAHPHHHLDTSSQ